MCKLVEILEILKKHCANITVNYIGEKDRSSIVSSTKNPIANSVLFLSVNN
jgi:hypothetical protein